MKKTNKGQHVEEARHEYVDKLACFVKGQQSKLFFFLPAEVRDCIIFITNKKSTRERKNCFRSLKLGLNIHLDIELCALARG